MSLIATDAAAAAEHLRAARAELDDATGRLRLATLLTWESGAGDRCRSEVSALLGLLDADAAEVDQAVLVAVGCAS